MNIYQFARCIEENENLNVEIETDSKGKPNRIVKNKGGAK